MFIRKKSNPSGVVSVQIIDKSTGHYKVVKTIGSSSNIRTVEELCKQGRQWIADHLGEQDVFEVFNKKQEELQVTTHLLSNIENILLNGTQLILNQVFKKIGFYQ